MRALPRSQRARRWLALSGAVVAVAIAAGVYAWPSVVRHVVVSRLEAMTGRPVNARSIALNPFTGRLDVAGLRVLEPDGRAPFAQFDRIHVNIRPLALLTGHVSLRELVLEGSTVRVVRLGDCFNFSDLITQSEPSERRLDVTVDRFVVTRGTVVLEDRALAEPRTWTSEQIEIDARNISTRGADGTAVASSITAGAPVSLEIRRMRLYPIHLEARATATGLDLSLARVYFPPDAALVLARGEADSAIDVTLDARDGVTARATGEVRDLALLKRGERDPAVLVPTLGLELDGLSYRDEQLAIDRFELSGSGSVLDPRTRRHRNVSAVRASIGGVTWPITTPGELDVEGRIDGGGLVRVTGRLRPPPDASQVRMRITGADLAPWVGLVPLPVSISGVAEADLRVNEPLAPAVPARVRGVVAVNRLSVRDGSGEIAAARRVEARNFEIDWPERLAVEAVTVTGPRATVERDADGAFPIRDRIAPARSSAEEGGAARDAAAQEPPPDAPLAVTVGRVAVRGGAVAWRDAAMRPAVVLDFRGIQLAVTGAAWPLPDSLDIEAAVQPPGGGWIRAAGRVGLEPATADLRVRAKDVELSHYDPYVPVRARVIGRAEADVTVAVAPADGSAVVRGRAALSRLDVRDGERTVLRAERAAATGLEVDWPDRVQVGAVMLQQPWVLLERDRDGALGLQAALAPRPDVAQPRQPDEAAPSGGADDVQDGGGPPAMTIASVAIQDGAARVVDQRVTPPFALDLQRLSGEVRGLSTDPASKPARVELTGRAARAALLGVRGTLGPVGAPLKVDLDAELRGFPVPRTNPYLIDLASWSARQGWLTTSVRCRIDGDALDARTELTVSRLELAKAGGNDEAKDRIGLPLGTIVALMKDARGDIHVSLPIGGRLSDPRLDWSELIWSTVRRVAVKAITAPISWIGRVRLTPDSRIAGIDLDPVAFPPGEAELTPEAREQVERIAAFLLDKPEARIGLTPLVSERDLAALAQRSGRRLEPDELAERRRDAVRARIEEAGVDGDRLRESPPLAAPADADPQVRLDLIAGAGASERPNLLRRLMGGAGTDVARH